MSWLPELTATQSSGQRRSRVRAHPWRGDYRSRLNFGSDLCHELLLSEHLLEYEVILLQRTDSPETGSWSSAGGNIQNRGLRSRHLGRSTSDPDLNLWAQHIFTLGPISSPQIQNISTGKSPFKRRQCPVHQRVLCLKWEEDVLKSYKLQRKTRLISIMALSWIITTLQRTPCLRQWR